MLRLKRKWGGTIVAKKPVSSSEAGLRTVFRSLRHRNYRLFFFGQGISLIGTWMQQVAMIWLVYSLTNSVVLLGIVGFVGQIPAFVFSPVAGALVDRWNRHRLIIITQSLSLLQAMVLALLVFTGFIDVWHIALMSVALGFINAFDMPARQAFVVEMVEDKRDLGNAIALNSSIVNAGRLIGPSIGGVLIATVGTGTCFFINGLSFLAVILALLAMRVAPPKIKDKRTHILKDLKEGFSYAFGFVPIKYIILLLGLVSLVGVPYQLLLPVFAKDILLGGPETLGFLTAASGVGALAGAVFLASRRGLLKLGRMVPIAAGVFGVGLIAFSLSNVLVVSLVFMAVTGFGMMIQFTSSNTTLQNIVDDDKRGRVMAFFMMAFVGTAPFGSLLAGGLANAIGAPNTLMVGGVCCIIGAIIFMRKLPRLIELARPVYRKKGIDAG
jgi:MFS family permease